MTAFWSAVGFALPLTVLWLLAGTELSAELATLPAWAASAAVAAHLATLGCRSEAWRLAVNSIAGDELPRPLMHGACAAGFAAGSIQAAGTAPVRAFALRRVAAERAPSFGQTMVAEGPVVTSEAGLAGLVLALGVAAVPVMPAWVPAGLAALCALGLVAMRLAPTGRGRNGLAIGLSVLGDRRRRLAFGSLIVAVTAFGLIRAAVLLAGFGLPHDLASVAIVFATLGVFGILPLGPAATAGAFVAAFGATDAESAASAGIALAATSMVAVAIYGLLALCSLALAHEDRTGLAEVVPIDGAGDAATADTIAA